MSKLKIGDYCKNIYYQIVYKVTNSNDEYVALSCYDLRNDERWDCSAYNSEKTIRKMNKLELVLYEGMFDET